MTCNCERGGPCSKITMCRHEGVLEEKQEEIDLLKAEIELLRNRVERLTREQVNAPWYEG